MSQAAHLIWLRSELRRVMQRCDICCESEDCKHAVVQVLFFMVLGAGVIFLSVLLYFTADIQFQRACIKVIRRLLKTVALRQARLPSHKGIRSLWLRTHHAWSPVLVNNFAEHFVSAPNKLRLLI